MLEKNVKRFFNNKEGITVDERQIKCIRFPDDMVLLVTENETKLEEKRKRTRIQLQVDTKCVITSENMKCENEIKTRIAVANEPPNEKQIIFHGQIKKKEQIESLNECLYGVQFCIEPNYLAHLLYERVTKEHWKLSKRGNGEERKRLTGYRSYGMRKRRGEEWKIIKTIKKKTLVSILFVYANQCMSQGLHTWGCNLKYS